MLMPLEHVGWAVLRKLVREKTCRGYDLRMNMSRNTRNGRHLIELEKLGLIEVIGSHRDGVLEKLYKLTATGVLAAEYGECEVPIDILRSLK